MRSASKLAAVLLVAAACGMILLFRLASTSDNSQRQHDSLPSVIESVIGEPPPSLLAALPGSSSVADLATNLKRQHGRRLSNALPDGGCELTWPQKPPPGVLITYAASYPGCGARMTWNLVEALTGLWTGDDWNNNGRGDEVITVKTHYPQSNGILVEFDERIQRGFIVIRNPMKSIPSFFNHIYEMRNHLPVHSERAPVEEWIKWRNAYLETEIAEYKKFICYWMDRYSAENRLLMTYEGLTDDLIGAEVARGLNDFLGQVEGVTTIDTASVPCIWRAVVKNEPPPQQAEHIKKLQALAVNQPQNDAQAQGQLAVQQQEPQAVPQQPVLGQPVPGQIAPQPVGGQPDPGPQGTYPQQPQMVQQPPLAQGDAYMQQPPIQQPLQQSNLRHRRLDPGHHDSQRKGPQVPRPYTPEQLDSMMTMLLEVAEKYQAEDARLYHVMLGYYEKIRTERIQMSPDEVVKPPGGFY